MPYRTVAVRSSFFRSIFLILMAIVAAGSAAAQDLAFTPGQYGIYAGNAIPPGVTKGGIPGPGLSPVGFTGTPANLVMGGPSAIVYDASGNLFIMDEVNNILRVVAASNNPIPSLPGVSVQAGHVYTVAGTTNAPTTKIPSGCVDVQGNGCPATQAAFVTVYSMAVDKNGSIYIADSSNIQIRAIYGGTGGLPGIANPKQGYMYALTNTTGGYAYPETGDNGPAVNAVDADPIELAVDSNGNIYFTNGYDSELRFIYNGGNLPSNFFPSGTTPTKGNIYLLSSGYETCPGTTHVCDGYPVGQATFNSDGMSLAVDASDNLYIYDKAGLEIRAVYLGGKLPGIDSSTLTVGNIYAVAGNGHQNVPVTGGPALQSPLFLTGNDGGGFAAIAFDNSGSFYFNGALGYISAADKIFKVDTSGILTIVFGGTANCTIPINTASSALPVDQQIVGCASTSVPDVSTNGLAFDSSGNLYLSNNANFGSNLIMKSNVSASAVAYTGTIGLPIQNQTVIVSNTGTQPLQLSNIAFTGPFSQVATGGSNDCSSSTSVPSGESCLIGVSFLPTAAGTQDGTLAVASNATNATNGSNMVSFSGTAAQASSSTKLTASPGNLVIANAGQTVTLTATVFQQYQDTLIPSGNVTFMDGATKLGSSGMNGTVAVLTTTSLAAGHHNITAIYSGDSNFTASTSAPFTVTVSATPVALVTITGSATSINGGQSVSFTAAVAAFSGSGIPTGTVSFQDGANPLPNSSVTLSGGTATFTTTALPSGNNQVLAVYNGDSSFGANSSTPVSVQVNAAGQLQFSPGIISLVSGSYFTVSGPPANGSAANAAQYSPGSVAVDSYGNTYTIGPSSSGLYNSSAVYVTASGNGPIPGVSSPQAGLIYLLGTSTPCAAYRTTACGDGGPVGNAFFIGPNTLAIDALNNIYVSDSGVIRKVAALTGNVTSVGGTYGTGGYAGDNGPATAATINVGSLFADVGGNIYIADNRDLLIRRIDGQTGIINTLAGLPPLDANDATPCSALPCGDGNLAVSAGLIGPRGIFVDQANNIYFGDDGFDYPLGDTKHVVRRIDGQTGIISLFAGQYDGPGQTNSQQCDPQEAVSCGDGGPATSATLNYVASITGDGTGNVYIVDNNLIAVRQINAKTGIINTVVGNPALAGNGFDPLTNKCSTAPCGDGGAATAALLANPTSIAVDPQGNIYVADSGTYTVRKVTGSTTTLDFGSTNLGTLTAKTVLVTNLGNQPVDITGLTVPINFPQQASGGTDCSASMTLASGDQCQLDLAFFPTDVIAFNQTAVIASNSANATNGENTITLTGTGAAVGGNQQQSITFIPPTGPFYAGQQVPLTATSSSGLQVEYLVTSGSAIILNNATASATLKITGPGKITVAAFQFGNSQYASAASTLVSLTATTPVLTFTAAAPSISVGTPLPSYNSSADYTVAGLIGNDTSSAITGQPAISVLDATGTVIPAGTVLEAGTYQVTIAQGTLSFPAYYQPTFVNGTLAVTGVNQQTVSFTGLPANVTYAGPATYTLNAVANDATTGKPDGQQITYSATGPATVTGNALTITGAGAVAVTATQPGGSTYTSAYATQTIQVAKAALTVTAVSLTYAQGVPLPALISSSNYTITGLAQGDTLSSVTGQPALSIVDTNGLAGPAGSILAAGATPPSGAYTVSISTGLLAAANYNFNFVNGTLTVNSGTAQTISFTPIPAVVYGAAPIPLGATASSTLAVSYTASPSNLVSLSGSKLTILGAGTVTVTASQAGNNTYAPAKSVQQILTIAPASLTVTAGDATRPNNTLNPSFMYSFNGFVNGDIQGSSVSGTPSLSTTATVTSPPGKYPIDFDINSGTNQSGSLTSANYVFTFVRGALVITSDGPKPDYSITATPQSVAVSQGQIVQLQVSLLPVNFYQGLVQLSCGKLPANVTCTFSPASLTATGNNASVSSTLTVNTNAGSPVVGQARPFGGPQTFTAAFFWLPGGVIGLLILLQRKRLKWGNKVTYLALLFVLLAASSGLVACGGSSSSSKSTLAQPGNSTFTVTATDSTGSVTHDISVALTVR